MDDYAYYIYRYFPQVLTQAERKAFFALLIRMKVARYDDPQKALDRFRKEGRIHDSEPEVAALLADGDASFYEKLESRVRTEHADEVFFNCCSECGGLTRTPQARQCLHCGHDWH